LAELQTLFQEDRLKLSGIWDDLKHATAFLILADCGLRSGELRALRWLSYIKEKAFLIDSAISKSGSLSATKTGQIRLVPVSTKAQA